MPIELVTIEHDMDRPLPHCSFSDHWTLKGHCKQHHTNYALKKTTYENLKQINENLLPCNELWTIVNYSKKDLYYQLKMTVP